MASSSSASTEEKSLILRSEDGKCFTIKESIAAQSVTIKNLVEANRASSVIPLPNLESKTLAMVVEYLDKHGDSAISEDDKKNFDSEFVKKEKEDLFSLISAAHNLEIADLLDLITRTIRDALMNSTVEEIRKYFNIKNDFTPEEEKAIDRENAWAFR